MKIIELTDVEATEITASYAITGCQWYSIGWLHSRLRNHTCPTPLDNPMREEAIAQLEECRAELKRITEAWDAARRRLYGLRDQRDEAMTYADHAVCCPRSRGYESWRGSCTCGFAELQAAIIADLREQSTSAMAATTAGRLQSTRPRSETALPARPRPLGVYHLRELGVYIAIIHRNCRCIYKYAFEDSAASEECSRCSEPFGYNTPVIAEEGLLVAHLDCHLRAQGEGRRRLYATGWLIAVVGSPGTVQFKFRERR